MVQTLSPGSWRSLMKTIFPLILPFVCAVVEDSCGVGLTELALIASTFCVVTVATTATTKQINKRKQAGLAWIELERMSNIKHFLSGRPPHYILHYGWPKRLRYSTDVIKALTISAF